MAESRAASTFVNSKYKSTPNSFSYKPRPPRQQRHSSSSNDKACVVCYRDVMYHSVGACEHPVCYECSSRMRVLLGQNECPICRQTLDHVLFTNGIKTYAELKDKIRMFVFIPKWSIYLEDEAIQAAFDKLLEHKCFLCSDQPTFAEFEGLREHIQRNHQLFACDLCVEHIKHFTKERKFYNRSDLAYHKRKGDRNDTSHRGHPLCKFCDRRFFDNDELFKHLRKDHYYCHFCDADGYNHYYNTYDDLRIHYRKEHFLCEEEACAEEKFTSVFRTEIDLKAHLASAHSRLLGKHGTKQARTLEIEFSLPKRPENERGRFGRPFGQRGRDDEHGRDRDHRRHGGRDHERGGGEESATGATGGTEEGALTGEVVQMPTAQPKMDSTVDFPTLGGEPGSNSNLIPQSGGTGNGASLAQKMALSSGMNVRTNALPTWKAGMRREEEFPLLLGAGPPVPTPQVTPQGYARPRQTIAGAASGQQPKPREVDFPSLSGSGKPPPINARVWQGSGPGSKLKTTGKGPPNGQMPKAHKVAPCPNFEEQKTTTTGNKDFNFVPLNVSSRGSKPNGGKMASNELLLLLSDDEEDAETEPKSGKKSKKKGNQKEKDQKLLAHAAAALFNGGTTPSIQSKPAKPKVPQAESDFPSLPTPVSAPRKAPPTKKSNPKGPQAPPPRKISPPPGFQLKRNDDDLDEEFRLAESSGARRNSGGSATAIVKTEPPPSKPPPGFETVQVPSTASTDVSFLDTVLQLNEISIPKTGEYRMYLQPSDVKARNERFLEAVRSSLCGDEATYESFLHLSKLFRKNEIPAQEYYDLCSSMFGMQDFRVIFSELVVLLPDIQKQQELLVTHRNCGGKGELLSTCHICHQVLKKGDVTFHMQTHASEPESFPTLGPSSSGRTIRQK